jgi:hypothetical protein
MRQIWAAFVARQQHTIARKEPRCAYVLIGQDGIFDLRFQKATIIENVLLYSAALLCETVQRALFRNPRDGTTPDGAIRQNDFVFVAERSGPHCKGY